jgi:hypothetical protein
MRPRTLKMLTSESFTSPKTGSPLPVFFGPPRTAGGLVRTTPKGPGGPRLARALDGILLSSGCCCCCSSCCCLLCCFLCCRCSFLRCCCSFLYCECSANCRCVSTGRQSVRQAGRQAASRPAGMQAVRQAVRQASRQARMQTHNFTILTESS